MLNGYGFDYKYLKLILSFLSNTKCRTKINSSFSERGHLLIVVPQGSEFSVVNSADDTTLYACEKKLSDVQRKLEPESFILFEWFRDNYLRTNSSKSHIAGADLGYVISVALTDIFS